MNTDVEEKDNTGHDDGGIPPNKHARLSRPILGFDKKYEEVDRGGDPPASYQTKTRSIQDQHDEQRTPLGRCSSATVIVSDIHGQNENIVSLRPGLSLQEDHQEQRQPGPAIQQSAYDVRE